MNSALDRTRQALEGLLPDLLGIEIDQVGPDVVVGTLDVSDEVCTVGGVAHGGALMALADTLGAVATVLNLPEGRGTATIESKTNFLRPAALGDRVIGRCMPLHKGRRTMTWETRLTVGDRLIAIVTQTQLVLEQRST